MRLLHSKTLRLREFIEDDSIPPYAILSHTWGQDEVTYQDMSVSGAKEKAGYAKIGHCCSQAAEDGFEWTWIDTYDFLVMPETGNAKTANLYRCCIDKSSSAELSEAINSMFRWYQNAGVCYAYLADVSKDFHPRNKSSEFSKSRWFTRGWTLQELIAPSRVIFYSRDWHALGMKDQLSDLVMKITGIDLEVLRGQDLVFSSISKRMSWAAHRKTSRIEDIAYCLLGIFDVNMPLLYGEGKKAFLRLQEEILKSSNDQTLFAWGLPSTAATLESFLEGAEQFDQLRRQRAASSNDYRVRTLGRPLLRGLFAESPLDFANGASIAAFQHWPAFNTKVPPIATNSGIRIELPLAQSSLGKFPAMISDFLLKANRTLSEEAYRRKTHVVVMLACHVEFDYSNCVGLVLQPWGRYYFGRLDEPIILSLRELPHQLAQPIMPFQIQPERLQFAVKGQEFVLGEIHYYPSKAHCIPYAYYDERTRILKPDKTISGAQAALLFRGQTEPEFAIVIGRDKDDDDYAWANFIILTEEQRMERLNEDDILAAKVMTETGLIQRLTDPGSRKILEGLPSGKWNLNERTEIHVKVEKVDTYQGIYFYRVHIKNS